MSLPVPLTTKTLKDHLPLVFFLGAALLALVAAVRLVGDYGKERRVPAIQMVKLSSLDRTPLLTLGGRDYAILGTRDGASGRSVLVREIETGKVRSFRVGENLFRGPVVLAAATEEHLDFVYRGKVHRVRLER